MYPIWVVNYYNIMVVICFKFWVSLTSLSLPKDGSCTSYMLWFAFNFGYLWHRYHSLRPWWGPPCSCDLLSILGIFDIAITRRKWLVFNGVVVICFQFWVSLTSLSLLHRAGATHRALWFAFNFGYLWHRYHSAGVAAKKRARCDLLSILGIFDIAITKSIVVIWFPFVVICFQFWVSLTSLSLRIYPIEWL